jgi:hypothetical protein
LGEVRGANLFTGTRAPLVSTNTSFACIDCWAKWMLPVFVFLCVCLGEFNRKGCARPLFAVDEELPVVFFNYNLIAHAQPQSCALADILGSEKRLS